MALNSGKILMRRGQEVNFDPNKMTPGEWAVSLDSKYVRMCFSPGVCVRMATYDAFEADMVQIQRILAECQTIEEAVNRINDEISVKAQAVAEYTAQAKQYRDEAEQFRNEAFSSTPEGYLDLVEQVGENTRKIAEGVGGVSSYNDLENKPKINDVVLEGEKTLEELGIASKEALEETDNKVNIIIENAELRFKETASGENIHLDDSTDSKLVEFGLYGKARQNTTTGKNLLPYPYKIATQTFNGITYTVNSDGTVKANGTATAFSYFQLSNQVALESNTNYIISANSASEKVGFQMRTPDSSISKVSYKEQTALTTGEGNNYYAFVIVNAGDTVNETIYPMLRLASITDNTWEPYTGGIPSPSPDYPQEIEVAGSSGSVEVKSVGKNLLPYPYDKTTHIESGVTWTDNNGIVTTKGTATAMNDFLFISASTPKMLKKGTYILSGCPKGGELDKTYFLLLGRVVNGQNSRIVSDTGNGATFTLNEDTTIYLVARFIAGTNAEGLTFKPMIRLASDTDSTYEPYKSKTATIPTENGLAGIPVDSGGNYTDSNGQQWICDEIVKYADGSGEKIQRVGIIDSYSAETITGVYMSTTGELTEGAKILYQLANPITTPLTPEQLSEIEKLSTFYPITNISNDFDCGMKVKYIADAKSYIDNRLALIEQAMLNSI